MAEVLPLRLAGTPLTAASDPAISAVTTIPAPDASTSPLTKADIAAVATALRQVDAAHRRLRTRLAHRLGLTVTDLTALVVISEATECTPKRLANELGLSSGTVTSVIDRLVDSGQVRRVPKIGDRRSILIELTAEAENTIDTVSGLYVGAISIALESTPHTFNLHIQESLRSTADALDSAGIAADVVAGVA